MKIFNLLENSSINNNILCEHGLSLGIEYKNHLIIYDVGQSAKFITNAKILGFGLESVDAVILSHGHYDHTGGLPEFLEMNKKAKVYIHEKAFKDRYSRSSKMTKFNGIPWLEKISAFEDRIVVINKTTELYKDFWLITDHSGEESLSSLDDRLVYKDGEEYIKDPFDDEIIIVVKNNKKPIVLSGCAHNGIVNILASIKNKIGINAIEWIIGGLHLKGASAIKIKHVIDHLKDYKITNWAINHCTGEEALKQFNLAFPGKVVDFKGGQIIES